MATFNGGGQISFRDRLTGKRMGDGLISLEEDEEAV